MYKLDVQPKQIQQVIFNAGVNIYVQIEINVFFVKQQIWTP